MEGLSSICMEQRMQSSGQWRERYLTVIFSVSPRLPAGPRLLGPRPEASRHPGRVRRHHHRRARPLHPGLRRHRDGRQRGLCSGCQGNHHRRLRQGGRTGQPRQQPQLRRGGRVHLRSEVLLREENMI